VLSAEALAQLPGQLLCELKPAVLALDMKRTNELIEQIRSYNSAAADALAKLADDFKFEEIVARIGNK